jgi:photosystem II stability/assembly factor-like uncharacterized protein
LLRVFGSNDKKQRGGTKKVGRNFSRLVLALVISAAGFLATGGRVATDLVKTAASEVYASPGCAVGWWDRGQGTAGRLTIYALASHPESPNVYAGAWWGGTPDLDGGVWFATSGENSWSPTSLITTTQVTSLAIDPASPAVVYAGTIAEGIKRRTATGGDIWEATTGLEGQEVWSLAVTSTANPVYAYAGAGGRIYVSTDGTSWELAGEVDTDKLYALAVDPQDSRIAYAGTKEKGVYQTTDGGINWTPRGLDGETVRALALHPENSEIIYAGTQAHGIFKSTDGGDSWSLSGLDGCGGVFAIVINPRNPEFVYAGTYGGGVWVSHSGGNSWYGMPGLTGGVYSLTLFSPEGEDEGQVLYAGTTDGVWARAVMPVCISYLPLVHKQ